MGNMRHVGKFTIDDIRSCWTYYMDYFADLLNGDYSLEDARSDLHGLVGSKYDPRVEKEKPDV